MEKKRLRHVLIVVFIGVLIGIAYSIFVSVTGRAIPCMFHKVTGLKCPGCGITRMCIAMLRLDFARAFNYNQAVFLLGPIISVIFLQYICGYVKTGKWMLNRIQTMILYIVIIILLLFGVLRNLF